MTKFILNYYKEILNNVTIPKYIQNNQLPKISKRASLRNQNKINNVRLIHDKLNEITNVKSTNVIKLKIKQQTMNSRFSLVCKNNNKFVFSNQKNCSRCTNIVGSILKSVTFLNMSINISLHCRFYPGGNGANKKIIDEITKKCIGAGCDSTRPFIPTLVSKDTAIKEPSKQVYKNSTISDNQNKGLPQQNNQVVPYNNNNNQMFFSSKSISNSNNNQHNLLPSKKMDSNVLKNITDKTIKDCKKEPQQIVKEKQMNNNLESQNIMTTVKTPINSDSLNEDFLIATSSCLETSMENKIIPTPLINITPTLPELGHKPLNFQDFYEKIIVTNNSTEIQQILSKLSDRNLLSLKHDQEKLTKEFYKYYNYSYTHDKYKLELPKDFDLKQMSFHIGLLSIYNVNETILLHGLHTHVAVIYCIQNNKKIILGYLTSEQDPKNIELSKTQPISGLNKPQLYHPLKNPQIMENILLKDLPNKTDQELAMNFINSLHVKTLVQNNFNKNTLEKLAIQEVLLDKYTGRGVTLNEINDVINKFDTAENNKITMHIIEYKKLLKEQNPAKVKQWLTNVEKVLCKATFMKLKAEKEIYDKIHNISN